MPRKITGVFIAIALATGCIGNAPAGRDGRALADPVASATVRVLYHLRYADGEEPGRGHSGQWYYHSGCGDACDALKDKRPMEKPGWLVAPDIVLTEDPMIEDRFVAGIEVKVAGETFVGRLDSLALENSGLFLKLSAPVEKAVPLVFAPDEKGPYYLVDTRKAATGFAQNRVPLGKVKLLSAARTMCVEGGFGPVVADSGSAVGFLMSDARVPEDSWRGSPLDWPRISADELQAKTDAVALAASSGIFQVVIRFRTKASRRFDPYYDSQAPTEAHAAGLYLGDGLVFVLANLTKRQTARIESLTVTLGEASANLTITGALKRYGVLVTRLEGTLEGADPLVLWKEAPEAHRGELMIAERLNFDHFEREERLLRGRFGESRKGFEGRLWPQIEGPSQDVFLFTPDGALTSAPIELRSPLMMTDARWRQRSDGDLVAMPSARLAGIIDEIESHVDDAFKVLSEEEAKRTAWLGVELQGLDTNLAREKGVAADTDGGDSGAIVIYVYPGSPAEAAGVEAGDVLLRFLVPGQKQPVKVSVAENRGYSFPWAQLDSIPDVHFERLPRPWPSRDNDITRFANEVAEGQTLTVVLVRDGVTREVPALLETAPRDFSSAGKFKKEEIGLTVKNLTYEVRRYFQMEADDAGVVISDIATGSKASVAGLKPCEIITQVNMVPVRDVSQFEDAVKEGGELSLTVKRMADSRVAQLYVTPSLSQEAADEEPSDENAPAESAEEPAGESAEEAPGVEAKDPVESAEEAPAADEEPPADR